MIEIRCINTIPRPTLHTLATLALATIGARTPKDISSTIRTTTVQSLEVRLTGRGEKVDWTLGFFYSDLSETWDFKTYIDNYADSMGFYYLTTYYGFDIAPSDAWWFSSQQTSRETMAVYGELDWNITENLALLLGGRWYDVEKQIDYFVQKPEGLFQAVPE
jgi:outer membrane receptor protein involved in Fe transport